MSEKRGKKGKMSEERERGEENENRGSGKRWMGKRYFGMYSLLVGAKSDFTGPIVTSILIL